jgi:hypothetical protein
MPRIPVQATEPEAPVEQLALEGLAPEPEVVEPEAPSTGIHPELQAYLDKGFRSAQLVVKTNSDGSFKSVEIAKNV